MKQTDDIPSPPPHCTAATDGTRINEQNVCRSSLDQGLVLGPLSQMTINYHQQVPGERERTQYSPSDICPRLPGSLRSRQDMIRFSSSRRQLESRASGGQITDDDDQAIIVSVVLPPPPVSADWCLRHSIRQQSIHQTKAWDRSRVTPVDRCQAVSAPTCVTIIPARLSSQKIIISGIGPVKIITTWFMSCTFM